MYFNFSFNIGYDEVGNIRQIEDMRDLSLTRNFGYDEQDRLRGAEGLGFLYPWGGGYAWSYDRTGNRLTEGMIDHMVGRYIYEPGTNKLERIEYPDGRVIEFAYDLAGKMTRYGDFEFDYDYADRLKTVWKNGRTIKVADYFYDWKNRRTRKVVYDDIGNIIDSRRFAYDMNDRVIYDQSSAEGTYQYIYLEGIPVGVVVGSHIYSIATDHLGTPWKAFDSSGNVVWEKYYDPWGNESAGSSMVTQTIDIKLRFPGQYYDSETGLHYNWNRYYSPVIGRYLSLESYQYPHITSTRIGIHYDYSHFGYLYSSNNPINFIDFDGLFRIDANCPNWEQIRRATKNVFKIAQKCLPNSLKLEFMLQEEDLIIRCEPDGKKEFCARTMRLGEPIIWINPNAFNPEDCGCLEGTVMHEIVHTIGKGEDKAYGCARKCINCSIKIGDPCACK